MGADIHLVLEKKNPVTGEWVGLHGFTWEVLFAISSPKYHASFPARDRNYDRFAELAGVRGEGPEPKGLPEDASSLTRMLLADDDDDDLHSHTWFPLAEAAEIFERTEHKNFTAQQVAAKLLDEKLPPPALQHYFGLDLDEADQIADFRLCIAFDN